MRSILVILVLVCCSVLMVAPALPALKAGETLYNFFGDTFTTLGKLQGFLQKSFDSVVSTVDNVSSTVVNWWGKIISWFK